jgi:hypothetical protein
MTKTAFLLALAVTALAILPTHAQPTRVFVSGHGLDTNPCTVTQPCRTFQQAHNTAAANGEIDVLDPAGYGPLTITKGISIQAHGFGGITETAPAGPSTAITINITIGDPVTLNGLLLDGGGSGNTGIYITYGTDTTIANSVISNNNGGLDSFGITWLAKTIISGNTTGIFVVGKVNSYGDNYIRDNGTPVMSGTLTPVTTQ